MAAARAEAKGNAKGGDKERDSDRKKANQAALQNLNKMLKTMGISAGNLAATAFKADCCSNWKDFGIFWLLAEERADEGTGAMNVLLKQLASAVAGDAKNATTADPIINTLSFLTLNSKFKPEDKDIVAFCKNWAEKATFPAANEVVRRLNQFVSKSDMLGTLIIGCSTLHTVAEFQRLADPIGFPTVDEADISGGDASFLYDYLRRLAEEGRLSDLLAETVNKMLTLGQQLKMNPKVAETTLLSLLHLFKQFMAMQPVADAAFLKRAQQTIQQFYLWPCPFANVARDALVLIRNELQCPGSANRARLLEDASQAQYQEDPKDEKKSAIYYFIDGDDRTSSIYTQLMDLVAYTHEKKRPAPKWKTEFKGPLSPMSAPQQLLCILSVIHADAPLKDEEVAVAKGLTNDDIYKLYQKFQAVIANLNKDPDLAKQERTKQWNSIKSEMKTMAAASKGKPAVKIADLEEPFTPSQPNVVHHFLPQKLGANPVSRENLSLMCLKAMPYPDTQIANELEQLLRRFSLPLGRDAAAPGGPATGAAGDAKTEGEGRVSMAGSICGTGDQELKIVIAGGNVLLHNFLCAYINVCQAHPEWLNGLRVKFYVVPFGENHLAAFLARYDGWYNRHIYVPFRSQPFLVPWLKERFDAGSDWTRPSTEPPGLFLRNTVESYVREAEVRCNVSVYKLQGWVAEGKGDRGKNAPESKDGKTPCDVLVPFVQQVEIGAAVAVVEWREKYDKKGIMANKKDDDIMKEKNFVFEPPEVIMKFARMDLAGAKTPTIADDPCPYYSLVMANIPRKEHQGFPADPQAPFLEMFARPHRTYQPRAGKKNPLVNDPKQHIWANTIECVNKGAAFSVLVDGQRFGPFTKIKISTIKEQTTARPITFPVQTFFPLDM